MAWIIKYRGLTVIDAPDGFKWTKGREIVVLKG